MEAPKLCKNCHFVRTRNADGTRPCHHPRNILRNQHTGLTVIDPVEGGPVYSYTANELREYNTETVPHLCGTEGSWYLSSEEYLKEKFPKEIQRAADSVLRNAKAEDL